jgi:hypothetical protein
MKILFINIDMHIKNYQALVKYDYEIAITKETNLDKFNLNNFDIVYSPTTPLHVSKYPNTKFIFGPHFSVFPEMTKLQFIIGKNVIYIQPSDWSRDIWRYHPFCRNISVESLPFGVDTDEFNEITPISERTNVFIYFKQRDPKELKIIQQFLYYNNIDYTIFDYTKKYHEKNYLNYLRNSKFGIWIGCHESQGFALEEALSCNVPLLVWDVTSMSQEYGQNYPSIKATSIPYWDKMCGEYFTNISQLTEIFIKFMNNIDNYTPRKYILENLSISECKKKFDELVTKFQ